jgi:uncharacterized protein (DUF2267 family)
MEYAAVKQRLMQIEGIGDEERADALIKSIAGHLVSRVSEETGRRICARLPEPLRFEKMRGHQIGVTTISRQQFIDDVCEQFGLGRGAVEEAGHIVLHEIKAQFSPDEIHTWESQMPADWVQMVQSV